MKQQTAILLMIGFPCSAFLFAILLAALWEYRVWVGVCLLTLIFLVAGVWIRGAITEQNLRIYRFNHKEETPLSAENMPQVLRPDMRERQNGQVYYQGYQQQ